MAKTHCCETMTTQVNLTIDIHRNPITRTDKLIYYSDKFNEYGLIVYNRSLSVIEISYCPWCGCKLPESKIDEYFDKLETQIEK